MLEQRQPIHWFLFAGLIIFWGSSFALTRLAVQTLSPEWTAAFRLLIAALILYGATRLQKKEIIWNKTNIGWFAWLGLVGSALPFLLISWGSKYISSGLAGILMAIVPLVVILLAHFLLDDEKITLNRFFGFILGFSGLVILLSPELTAPATADWLSFLAQLAILLAATSYAIQAVTSRLSPPLGALEKAAGTHIFAAGAALSIALVLDPTGWTQLNVDTVVLVAALGIFPTAMAGFFLFYLLEKAGASFVAMSNYLVSPFAFLIGIIFLSEPFHWYAMFGLITILAGIALSEKK